MTLFVLTTDAFLIDRIYKSGSKVNWDGPVGSHFQAVDQEGQDKLDAYYTKNPQAAMHPTEYLPKTMAPELVEEPKENVPVDPTSLLAPEVDTPLVFTPTTTNAASPEGPPDLLVEPPPSPPPADATFGTLSTISLTKADPGPSDGGKVV